MFLLLDFISLQPCKNKRRTVGICVWMDLCHHRCAEMDDDDDARRNNIRYYYIIIFLIFFYLLLLLVLLLFLFSY